MKDIFIINTEHMIPIKPNNVKFKKFLDTSLELKTFDAAFKKSIDILHLKLINDIIALME